MTGPQEKVARHPALAGTAWQLVRILSMDDRIDVPDAPAKYSLELGADSTATIGADCNRGSGTWTSTAAGALQFGPIAATKALCLPGSLSERYLTQFQWVRSYVMENGHLFLARMADGSIIEMEPAGRDSPAATVLGEAVHTMDPAALQEAILTPLLDHYAAAHGIQAEPAEIEAFVQHLRQGLAVEGLMAEETLTPAETAEIDSMRHDMARAVIRQWKINQALYAQYGGRIIYQQLGPEPLDAYRKFLEQRQAEEAFRINDPALAEGFWRYFRDESIHDFMEPGGADAARALEVPPWQDRP